VRGRYVKVPLTNPHYPTPHYFWSNWWTHNDYDKPEDPPLGDITHRSYAWNSGNTALPLPDNCTVFNTPATSYVGQWDARCYPGVNVVGGQFNAEQFSDCFDIGTMYY
jgi:hypothetical protein